MHPTYCTEISMLRKWEIGKTSLAHFTLDISNSFWKGVRLEKVNFINRTHTVKRIGSNSKMPSVIFGFKFVNAVIISH